MSALQAARVEECNEQDSKDRVRTSEREDGSGFGIEAASAEGISDHETERKSD